MAAPHLAIPILHEADVLTAKGMVCNVASEIGFSAHEREELQLVVAELASNLIKHARGGRLHVRVLERENKKGLEIEADDDGPGFGDTELALKDGYSTAGSLGYGLGTVNRLTDEMELTSASGAGSRVICRRWPRPKAGALDVPPVEFGVVSRPKNDAPENGDTFVVKRWHRHALAVVIDGLGHGPLAARAAAAARNYVETHFDQPLDNILRGTDRACRATRGVVMALAGIDAGASLRFSGIGNIEARICGGGQTVVTRSVRGIVGAAMPSPKITEHAWGPDHMLVMHSDGIRSDWRWTDFPGLEREEAAVVARQLFQTLARGNDDATVLVMKSAAA